MPIRRTRLTKPRRRPTRRAFWTRLAAVIERSADDGATLCTCADGNPCVA